MLKWVVVQKRNEEIGVRGQYMSKKVLVLLLLTTLLVGACGKKTEVIQEETEPPKQAIETVEEEVEVEEEGPLFPLTGTPVEEEIDTRAVAVMINNHPAARQQSGLSQADVVYEVLAEGDLTRFLAIFQSEKPANIGPIRSARDYYIDLAQGYDSLYIAHGYSPKAHQMLMNGVIDHLNGMQYDGSLFKRSSAKKAPHNSYTTFENIEKGAESNGYEMTTSPEPLPFLTKEEVNELSGDTAEQLTISYSSSSNSIVDYEYDHEAEKYKRFSGGELTEDIEAGAPVLLDNILIIETNHRVIDDEGRHDIDLTSGGNGYLIQRGVFREIEWKNVDGRILPYDGSKALGFVPGKTWINIVPSNDIVEMKK